MRTPIRFARPLALAACLLVTGSLADGPPTPQQDWHAWVDPDHGFAVVLPPSHRLARSSTEWYVHGMFDDETPLVPDVAISFLADLDAEQALTSFSEDATASDVAFGPGTRGLWIQSARRAKDGTPYLQDAYLIEAPAGAGTFRIIRYEGFLWEHFEAVARSFHFVRTTGDPLP